MGRIPQGNPLGPEQIGLLRPAGYQPSRVVDDPVAGVLAVARRHAQHPPHQPGIFLPPDQHGNLPIGGDTALGDFPHHRQDFIGQVLPRDSAVTSTPSKVSSARFFSMPPA